MPLVEVINLGKLRWSAGYKIQQYYVQKMLASIKHGDTLETQDKNMGNKLLLAEHSPAYTVGIRRKEYSADLEAKLRALGADFHRTDRGGLITFHGPGQLTVYPILNLKHFKCSVRWYICQLEKTVERVCAAYGVRARGGLDNAGVWVEDRKIAAVGINGKRWVMSHGLGINCSTDLSWFDHIVPCGIEGKEVTSLTRENGRKVAVEDAMPVLVDSFSKQFGAEVTWKPDFRVDDVLSDCTS